VDGGVINVPKKIEIILYYAYHSFIIILPKTLFNFILILWDFILELLEFIHTSNYVSKSIASIPM
jgi:hypothetical protein